MLELWSLVTQIVKHCRIYFFVILCILFVTTAINYAHPFLLGMIIDDISAGKVSFIYHLVLLYIIAVVIGIILTPIERGLLTRIIHRSQRYVSIEWNNQLLAKDYRQLQALGSGKIITAFQRGMNGIESILFDIMEYFFTSLFVVFVVAIYIVFIGGWWIIPFIVLPSVWIFYIQSAHTKKMESLLESNHQFMDEKSAYLADMFSAAYSIRLANAVKNVIKFFMVISDKFHANSIVVDYRRERINSINTFGVGIIQSLILFVCILSTNYAELTYFSTGEILSLYMYSSVMTNNLMMIPSMKSQITMWLSQKKSVTDILDIAEKKSIDQKHLSFSSSNISYDITLCQNVQTQHNIYYKHPLHIHTSYTIPFQSKVAIFGDSGQGKSTLAEGICGFHESINVLLSDRNPYHLPFQELSKTIFYAESQTKHLSGTFWECVMFGQEFDTKNAQDLLSRLELSHFSKYLTNPQQEFPVESISSGENKRLGIFRAILLHRPITVLDEPTEALDPCLSKKNWQEIYNAFSYGTLICITHDLQHLSHFDIVFKIEDHTLTMI